MATKLRPAPGYALVELKHKYEGIETPEEKYNTATEGICITVTCIDIGELPEYYDTWVDNRVFWEEFNASKRIEHDGKTYAFIKLEDIRGIEVEANQKTD